jgi:8-oxo-dGTP diphosphatase
MKKITLAGCVILNQDAILLLHRIKKDWYELPGGKIDAGETPRETAKRELLEELQCDVKIIHKIGEKDFKEHGYIMGYIWFLTKIKEGQTPHIGEPDKFSEYKYIPIQLLKNHKLSINMQNFVSELERGRINLH